MNQITQLNPTLAKQLLRWYQLHQRKLPWREGCDPYHVLVSELMLQQTTVAAVIPLYERWMNRFPTLESLAQASHEQVMESWSGLGYYSRATRLHQTAQILQETGYPETLEGWLEMPGLGPYTAAAVVSIAFGRPHLALDTNVLRVLLRFFGWEVRPDSVAAQRALRTDVETALPDTDFGQLNQALMELGATICRIRTPLCLDCPIHTECRALAQGKTEQIPRPKPKKAPRQTHGSAYLLGKDSESAILVQGTSLGLLGQLFQPLIDIPGENRPSWPWNTIYEELRAETSHREPLGRLVYAISGRRLELEIYHVHSSPLTERCQSIAREESLPTGQLWRSSIESIKAVSSLTRKIAKVWVDSL